ncbi:MAG: ABC-F family ATP-binding cassette domain-containing protein [Firmicutes bacterium]|nr:ABC-F family ATP-binding cassette domain-containing protein [Bacillota bacterium]
MILSTSGIKKSFITHEVLKNVTFHIEAREKLALIGVNGAGKSTLFHILRGEMEPDEGQIFIQKNLRIGYLPQTADYQSDNRIEDELLTVFKPLQEMEAEMRSLEQIMQSGATPEQMDRYSKLLHDFEEQNGYGYHSMVRGVLNGLGFEEEEYQLPINYLSGGQKTRIMLGKLLLQAPDLLLLDEPTNHLDIESISWLESYLAAYKGAAIIISHDRYFLDKLCTKTMEIERGVATVYNGNYSYYIGEKEVRQKVAMREYEAQQTEIKRQEEIITKLRGYGMEKFIRRAQSREKILDKMELIDRPTELNASMNLHFTPSIQSAEIVLTAQEVSKQFDGRELFRGANFQIRRGERVALIGANGIGKTTLFKMIMGQLSPSYGDLHLGVKVYPGYYDQTQENLSPEKSILDEIYDSYPNLTIPQIRNILGSFLFRGDDVFKQIKTLSGGEKARVSLCKIMLGDANFLLLDEPTNHLDIISREILESNLVSYEGTLLFISHDRYFINQVATRIIELTPDEIIPYLGNYDFYLEHRRVVEQKKQEEQPASQNKEAYTQQKMASSELRKKKARRNKLEKEIEEAETQIEEIKEKMLLPEFYSSATAYAELEQQIEMLEESIMEMMEEWNVLSEELNE